MPTRRNIKKGFVVIEGSPGNFGDSKFFETEEEANFEVNRIFEQGDNSRLPVYVLPVTQYSLPPKQLS